jgi:hypothetical protein
MTKSFEAALDAGLKWFPEERATARQLVRTRVLLLLLFSGGIILGEGEAQELVVNSVGQNTSPCLAISPPAAER